MVDAIIGDSVVRTVENKKGDKTVKAKTEYFGLYTSLESAKSAKIRAFNKFPNAKRKVVKRVAYSVLITHQPLKGKD